MKKPKFQIKIDRNNRCKVYINKKWQKNVCQLDFHGLPQNYRITLYKYARDERGQFIVIGEGDNVELLKEKRTYFIGKDEE